MRKIASHFWLRPDGTVGKFPIISFDNQNRIIEIRERAEFEEEVALELVNGFLIPGLVDVLPKLELGLDTLSLKRILNRLIVRGVKAVGVPNHTYSIVKNIAPSNLSVFNFDGDEVSYNGRMGFEKIQEASNSLEELMNLTMKNALGMGALDQFGSLELGKCPGLLAISNMGYDPFNIHPLSKLKIIL